MDGLASRPLIWRRFPHVQTQSQLHLPELRRGRAAAGRANARPAASGIRWPRKAPSAPGRAANPSKGRLFALEPLTGEAHEAPRLPSGIAEFDRVTGGGFVRGSVLLMAGDPGIGKSTLLIQAAAALARAGDRAVYISGEEAVAQVRLRAERLALAMPRSSSRPRPRSRTSSPPCRKARRRG